MTSRPSTAAPILAVLAIALPLLLLGSYVGGDLRLGGLSLIYHDQVIDGRRLRSGKHFERAYGAHWQAVAFWPAAHAETWLRRVVVKVKPREE